MNSNSAMRGDDNQKYKSVVAVKKEIFMNSNSAMRMDSIVVHEFKFCDKC